MPVANLDLLIQQWRDQPNLRAVVNIWLQVYIENIERAHIRLEQMRNIDQAEGVWLDFIGERLGIFRPSVDSTITSLPFGFARADGTDASGLGWDQSPFGEASVSLDNREKLGDAAFRRLVKARGWYVWSLGNLDTFIQAVREIDSVSDITDNRDMTITVETGNKPLMDTALLLECLPNPAAVSVNVDDGTTYDVAANIVLSISALSLFESRSGQYFLRLSSPPAFGESVSVAVASADASKVSVMGGPYVFTRRNWSQNMGPVVVTAETDSDTDDETVNITHTATSTNQGSSRYAGLTPVNLEISVTDASINAGDPIISISAFLGNTSIREGDEIRIDLAADIAFTGSRTIWFLVSMVGNFAADDQIGYRSVVIAEGDQSGRLAVATIDDSTVESAGSITARILETDLLRVQPRAGDRPEWAALESGDVLTITDGTNTVTAGVVSARQVGSTSRYEAILEHQDWSSLSGQLTITDQDSNDLGDDWEANPEASASAVNANTEWYRNARQQGYGFDADNDDITYAVADNDTVIVPELSVNRVSAASITEGTNLVFRFAGDEAPNTDITIRYMVAQTGNVVANSELGMKTLLLPSGIISNDITIPTIDDDAFEAAGVVTVSIVSHTSYAISSTAGSASGTVTSEDEQTIILPGVPTNIRRGTNVLPLGTGTYVDVVWTEPSRNGGPVLTGYRARIAISDGEGGFTRVRDLRTSTAANTDIVITTTRSTEPFWWEHSSSYRGGLFVQLAGVTENGIGPFSEWTSVHTI